MLRPRFSLGVVLGLGLLPLAGCSRVESAETDEIGPPTHTPGGSGDVSFLSLVPEAPFRVAYRGTRLVELYYDFPVIFREDVGSDGAGKFSIEATNPISQHPDPNLFVLLQDLREVTNYRFRDFRIRDYYRFQQNYVVTILDNANQVAGIATVQIDVRRVVGGVYVPRSNYVVDIDPVTGLVMRWEEREIPSGALLGRVEFESITYGGDVSDMTLVDRLFPTQTFTTEAEFEQVAGFKLLIPTLLPTAEFVVEPEFELMDGTWAKMYLTDGLDLVIFMHQARKLNGQNYNGKLGLVSSLQVGSWAVLRGDVAGYQVLIAGKRSVDELPLILQSALPD